MMTVCRAVLYCIHTFMLVYYTGFLCGFDENYFGEKADPAMLSVEQPAQKSWITRVMTQPLKQIARKYIGEQQEYLKQEIEKRAPQIQEDRAAYGHIHVMRRGSTAHKEWLAHAATEIPNPHVREGEKATWSYGAANPIVLEDEIMQENTNRHAKKNLAYAASQLYAEKQALESELYLRGQKNIISRQFDTARNKKDRQRIARINWKLEEIENELDLIPVYEAGRRIQEQNVRQERLKDLEKRYKHPTDYYLNNKAFIEQMQYYAHGTPYKGYVKGSQDMLEQRSIPTLEKRGGGSKWDYSGMLPAFDPSLTNLLYNKSDELLQEKMQGLHRGEADHVQKAWSRELTRLENKKRARVGKKPTQHAAWLDAYFAKKKKEETAEECPGPVTPEPTTIFMKQNRVK